MSDLPLVLIISHEFDPHVDQMLVMLRSLGVECRRWIVSGFPLESSLDIEIGADGVGGRLVTPAWEFDPRTVRGVWYRRIHPPKLPPGLNPDEERFARAEVRAALGGLFRAFDWFWVNHPDRVRVADSKPAQLRLAHDLGFRVPRTLITNDPDRVRAFHAASAGRIVYKPFNSGFFADTQKICYTTPLAPVDLDALDLIRATPGIFQEYIPKKLELRVTIIGRAVFATEIHSQEVDGARVDWRSVDAGTLRHAPHRLPEAVEHRCRAFLDRFGLVFGAMDLILTPEGEYVFLENNPTGQFGWLEEMTGEPMTATLARLLLAGAAD